MKKGVFLLLIIGVFVVMILVNKKESKNIIEDEFIEQIYSDILIENQDFDFGLISVNDTVSHTYKLKNISDEPLIVTNVISNCDCVEIDYVKTPLQKNQQMDISATFIAKKDRLGNINNLMLIECNIEKGAEVISMSGFVSDSIN